MGPVVALTIMWIVTVLYTWKTVDGVRKRVVPEIGSPSPERGERWAGFRENLAFQNTYASDAPLQGQSAHV